MQVWSQSSHLPARKSDAHDGLQVSLHPGCAQGQGQGQMSRDTGTFVQVGTLSFISDSSTGRVTDRRMRVKPRMLRIWLRTAKEMSRQTTVRLSRSVIFIVCYWLCSSRLSCRESTTDVRHLPVCRLIDLHCAADSIQILLCDFLLVRHNNLGPILHRFRDIARFCTHDPTPIPP